MEIRVSDPSKVYQSPGMVKSKSVDTISPLQKEDGQRGHLVNRGVGSAKLVKSSSSNSFISGRNLDIDSKVCINDFHFLFII